MSQNPTFPSANQETQPRILVSNLSKEFRRTGGERVTAIDRTDLAVGPGELVVLLGPSGCGKTTLLRCIAGLETPDSGEIRIGDDVVYSSGTGHDLAPERRGISMMFQSYALWPHMKVFENVAYPLRSRGVKREEVKSRVELALQLVKCEKLASQHTINLSGGQQQRIALARALVANDVVVLFDEPLSNIDAKVREELRIELLSLQRKIGFSAVYVTHDQTEAMALADRIAVLDGGRIVQLGSPSEVYNTPDTLYVARFLGSINELEATEVQRFEDGTVEFETTLGRLHVSNPHRTWTSSMRAIALFRPEHCRLSLGAPTEPVNLWKGHVRVKLFLGSHTEYIVDVEGGSVRVGRPPEDEIQEGMEVWLTVPPEKVILLPRDGSDFPDTQVVR